MPAAGKSAGLRAEPADTYLREALAALADPPPDRPSIPPPVDPATLIALFDAQLRSRHLDLAARWLQSAGGGFYTIGSAGHEGNAAVAAALRPTDPALLHYRSGAFYLVRAAQVADSSGVRDVLLGLVAATADPASGGRHKVFGSARLAVIPQTSTIASHLPRAVGVALAIELAARLGLGSPWPADAIAVCSFGDASANHSTATGALNAASQHAYRGRRLPLLFICEDNGLGISVRTPEGWTEHALSRWSPLRYEYADGADLIAAAQTAAALVSWVRENRRPAILHLSTVRLMGHAGSDAEIGYRTAKEIADDYAQDPLLGTARMLLARRILTSAQLRQRYQDIATEVHEEAAALAAAPRLSSRAEVMAPLLACDPAAVRQVAGEVAAPAARLAAFQERLPEKEPPLTLAQAINASLTDLMARHADITVFGEDVARKGGVYGVTRNLLRRFGSDRVTDTLLDEQTILGEALGAAISGFLPIPEIQYLAYVHNAADQIRGEAASLSFFSGGTYHNGMVIRIPGLAYQKGFGGHFHNDNSVSAFRDIPGLIIAVPSSAAEAPGLLRSCAALARAGGRVCIYLEPIALYHVRDLYELGDSGWQARYVAPPDWDACYPEPGRARAHGDGRDLTIVTFGNGVLMSLRVANRLAARGIGCRVLDLRWLAPLATDDVLAHAGVTGRVLVADETRVSGGVGEAVLAALASHGFRGPVRRVCSADSFIPLGTATRYVLLGEDEIEEAALAMTAS